MNAFAVQSTQAQCGCRWQQILAAVN